MVVCSIVVGLCEAEHHGGNHGYQETEGQRGTQDKMQRAETSLQ